MLVVNQPVYRKYIPERNTAKKIIVVEQIYENQEKKV